MKKLSLNDIGKPISVAKGWTEIQVSRRRRRYKRKDKKNDGDMDIKVIMVIKAPDKSVLVITDYPKIITTKKCKVIKEFMRRNRQNGTSH